jgi:hypothetical protein
MMTLIVAAAVAAHPAPPADPHGQSMQSPQHEAMKDCCKDGCKCCKDMAGKDDGHGAERGEHQ